MANPYTSVSVSGYNADAPSDDGSAVASNQLNWSKHKTKLGDPLKTAVEAINSNVNTAFGKIFGTTITSKSSNYEITVADQGSFLEATSALTFTLPAAATAGNGFAIALINNSTGAVAVDGNSSETINGNTSYVLGQGEFILLTCDGSEWVGLVCRIFAGGVDTQTGDYTVTTADRGRVIECSGSLATVTLLAAATAGDGFVVAVVNNTGGDIAIDGNSSETINGSTSQTIGDGFGVLLACDGSAWVMIGAPGTLSSLGLITAMKTGDESDQTTTVQDDDHLAGIALAANTRYMLDGFLEVDNPTAATGDAKIVLTFTQAPADAGSWGWFRTDAASDVDGDCAEDVTAELQVNLSGRNDAQIVHLRGWFQSNAASGGTVKLQWSKLANGGADPVFFREGTWLRFTPVP